MVPVPRLLLRVSPLAQRAPGRVLVLLTEAWSPRDCFGGELLPLTYSVVTFCHTGGQAGGSTQKCLLGVTGDTSAVTQGGVLDQSFTCCLCGRSQS